ncbi:MAG TPA: amino acid ABC transporter permease [Clostridia bacterium]|jgi:polar amino acid transport system permease protein|nr:amino acid ABC transporter permease [Clostridia bacterium]HOL60495.1 amino acid ABC transporter permease [Clostridia bacterium]HPO52902.1 amino acid ABC transporter permease [Clostridia bacterium]
MNFGQVTLQLLEGFGTTVLVFALTLAMALPLGLIVAFGSMTKFKPLRWLTRTIVWIIRGTPLMLQVIVVFYVPGLLFGVNFTTRFTAVIIAFVINYACYFSEIYRGGIESISKGQYEAGQVLGMTKAQIFFKIVLFQVVKRIMAPVSNEVITLVKDTALARVIAVEELISASNDIMAGFGIIYPLFYAGVFYLIFCGILTVMFNFIEKKLDYYR